VKAILCTAYGPPEVLRLGELPAPEPKRGQVRIRMHATAATYSDCLIRGLAVRPFFRLVGLLILGYRRPRRLVLGIVVAGEIDRVGAGVKTFREGDSVFGMEGWGARSYAEYGADAVIDYTSQDFTARGERGPFPTFRTEGERAPLEKALPPARRATSAHRRRAGCGNAHFRPTEGRTRVAPCAIRTEPNQSPVTSSHKYRAIWFPAFRRACK